MKILKNQIECKNCGEIIESRYTYDFVTCACGKCSVDGGHEYLKRLAEDKKSFIERSIIEE